MPHRPTTSSDTFREQMKRISKKDPSLREQISARIEKLQEQLDFSNKHHHHIPTCQRSKMIGSSGYLIVFHDDDGTLFLDALIPEDDL